MQFSQHWLHTWVNPELSATELAHLLTMAGLEVEDTLPAAPAFTGWWSRKLNRWKSTLMPTA